MSYILHSYSDYHLTLYGTDCEKDIYENFYNLTIWGI